MADVEETPAEAERKRDRLKRYAGRYSTVPLFVRGSDLPKRAASAVVMLAIAGTALWLGGAVWMLFVAAVALGVLWEWQRLVRAFAPGAMARAAWMLGGLVYIGVAAGTLAFVRTADGAGASGVLMILGGVIGVDVGAYFAGRAIGGPKIAPRISPSKTWAGLGGGVVGAALVLLASVFSAHMWATGMPIWPVSSRDTYIVVFDGPELVLALLAVGAVLAVIAQSGDFFESWMKRRAGVKDSSNLIPGHGGFFDRVDGLLAVSFVLGIFGLVSQIA